MKKENNFLKGTALGHDRDYYELENGSFLKNLNDGRYIDEENNVYYIKIENSMYFLEAMYCDQKTRKALSI